ncbi:MAG: threonine--tRNA ligase, partial [Parcubacteria group bacterium]|nr:threonine--tRNA ligase [Parcubacteria group bacterium]
MAHQKTNVEHIRHSLAHILAMAVLERWPTAKLGVGPTIENGFYYDFELPSPAKPEDLPDLEKRMRRIIGKNVDFKGTQVSFQEARKIFHDQPYKLQ